MCGRFTLEPTAKFYKRFGIANRLPELGPRYNIAPGTMVPVIVATEEKRLVLMRWGLIPHWAKDEKTAYKMINARVETLTTRPAYRGLLSSHRCVVPASGFYEWKAEGRGKIPYFIHPSHEEFVAFAGLYDVWRPAGTETEISTFTIVTTEADTVVGRVHNRMPVMLRRELEDAWLDPDRPAAAALEILRASRSVPVEAYPVSTRVNRPSIDDASLIEPIQIQKTGR
jgi:putative SOS response-associated peptidase YedK